MGLIADAAKRVLAYTTRRTPPTYSTPPTRPADASSTNADTSVQNIRHYVAEGSPARTKPTTGSDAGSIPSPHGADVQAAIDRRRGNAYPRPGSESSTNTSASTASATRYGLQPDTDRVGIDILPNPERDK